MGIYQVNHSKLENILKKVYETKTPIFILGTFGIGKSESVRKVAKEIAQNMNKKFFEWNEASDTEKHRLLDDPELVKEYFIFADIRLNQYTSDDLKGLPDFNGRKDVLIWKPTILFKILSFKGATGIIFLDERNAAPPIVQTSCYQVIHDRGIGELKFSDGIGIVSAGNRIEDKGNIFETPTPLRDREIEVELLIPTKEEWTEWALNNQIESRIISFINAFPNKLFVYDPDSDDKPTTPRGWARLSLLIKGEQELTKIKDYACMSIGNGIGTEFAAFIKLNEKIDIPTIFKNPKMIKEISDVSLKYAVLSGISEYYRENKKVETLRQVVMISKEIEPEFARLLLRFTKMVDEPFFMKNIVSIKEFNDIYKEFSKYML